MMAGRLYVDGHDAYLQWGAYVVSGGWNEALSYPSLKATESYDWPEEDGEDVDLTDPKLDTKEFAIHFAYSGGLARFSKFIDTLSDGAYHVFDCASIRRRFRLRMTQTPNLDMVRTLGFITIRFCNDFPLDGYTYKSPQSGIQRAADYLLDGIPFSDYGCRILQGSLAEVVKTPAVKLNLLRNLSRQEGAEYDGYRVTFKSKDVKLYCLMRADTLDELWRNYDALLYDLVRPEERWLEVGGDLQQIFPCHYKSASVTDFYPEDRIWFAFTLTLTFTHSFRLFDDDFVLATEDGILVFTEDGRDLYGITPAKPVDTQQVSK